MPAAKLVDLEEFRNAARRGRARADVGVYRITTGKPKVATDGSRKIRFCFSDGSVDRMGDSIDPQGWVLTDFMRNPVALWAHDSYSPPIGRASRVQVEQSRLMGDIEFAAAAAYQFADTIYELIKGGFINAVSVGFMPLEYSFVEDKDRPWGIDFKRQELLEISVCPVPCNANALVEAMAKGINVAPLTRWAERVLAGGSRSARPSPDPERAARERRLRTVQAISSAHRVVAEHEARCEQFECEQRIRRAARGCASARAILAR